MGRLAREIPADLPIIAAGGIHSPQDARDYIDAGGGLRCRVDTATWARPKMLERIARDLGGWIATRQKDALPDEWNPDMGHTEALSAPRRAAGVAIRSKLSGKRNVPLPAVRFSL